jgi:hypothetical protein
VEPAQAANQLMNAGPVGFAVFIAVMAALLVFHMTKNYFPEPGAQKKADKPENGYKDRLFEERHHNSLHAITTMGENICEAIDRLGDRIEHRMDLDETRTVARTKDAVNQVIESFRKQYPGARH